VVQGLLPHSVVRREVRRFLACARDGHGDASEIVDDHAVPRASRAARVFMALAYAAVDLRPAAIRRFSRLAEHPEDGGSRTVLARLVGADVRDRINFQPRPGRRRARVFDVFPFNDELDLLDLRLHEMAEWVDLFVVVESRLTFTGRPKPLHFQQSAGRYAAYADKIRHIVVEDYPDHIDSAWAREFYQRDMGLAALKGRCLEEDLVLISDVDEIVARSALEGFDGEFASLRMEQHRYFLNYRRRLARHEQTGLTSVWRARYLKDLGLSYARHGLPRLRGRPRIFDAGWHFTSISDAAGLVEKMQNSSHQEFNRFDRPHFESLLAMIRNGADEPGWSRVELDESFPAYIREHRAELARLLL
jgi:hypothetical protein